MRQGFDRLRYAPADPFIRKRRWSTARVVGWGLVWIGSAVVLGALVGLWLANG